MFTRTHVLLASAAGIVLLGATGAALADRDERHGAMSMHGEMMMEMLDTDGDGKVSRAEAETFRDARFATFDKDGNGELSFVEYTAMMAAMREEMMQRRFARHDADNSGGISKAEMSSRMDRMFEMMDRNDDGAIERGEMGRHKRDGEGRQDGKKRE
jgi:Ca2+-binding EF-hand superfamily protein